MSLRKHWAFFATESVFIGFAAFITCLVASELHMAFFSVVGMFFLMLSGPVAAFVTLSNYLSRGDMLFIVLSSMTAIYLIVAYFRQPTDRRKILACLSVAYWLLLGIWGTCCTTT
jgi:uncharacterized membrane protein